ncbi:MAG: dienelactone hydrolase family protein [Planctomycetes bacterium]|nr:dienelactone hydrolase family protein [Planctomycetota bacterium]
MIALVLALALAAPTAPPPVQSPATAPAESKVPKPTRADLARSYLRFEELWKRFPPPAERLADAQRAFDQATMAFFVGNTAGALRTIDGLALELLPPEMRAPAQQLALRARFDPPVGRWTVDANGAAPTELRVRVRIDALYAIPGEETRPRSLRVQMISPGELNKVVAEWETSEWSPGAPLEHELVLQKPVPFGYSVSVLLDGQRKLSTQAGSWRVLQRSLDDARQANAAELDALATKLEAEDPVLAAALAACRARNALLVDAPSETASAQFLARPEDLAFAVEAELTALKDGRDPYRRRAGDLWRTVCAGKNGLPVRVFAPPAACTDAKAPLVIALHGAGGDENMFFEGYGAGKIVELAKAQGFVVAAPLVGFGGLSGDAFDALVTELVYDYAIDPERVYVVGHSMGAGAACGLAASRRERIAAVACFAGGSAPKDRKMAPTRIWAGELDPLAKPEGLMKMVEKARAEGAPIQGEVVPDHGHTLVVGARLAQAVDWLLERRLAPPPSADGAKK